LAAPVEGNDTVGKFVTNTNKIEKPSGHETLLIVMVIAFVGILGLAEGFRRHRNSYEAAELFPTSVNFISWSQAIENSDIKNVVI